MREFDKHDAAAIDWLISWLEPSWSHGDDYEPHNYYCEDCGCSLTPDLKKIENSVIALKKLLSENETLKFDYMLANAAFKSTI